MCGIIGYVGKKQAAGIVLQGLHQLEYRGYDSAGVASVSPQKELTIVKAKGRVEMLEQRLVKKPARGSTGIGHTRWATHGPATDENAHPHTDNGNTVAVVHNGVINNYRELRERLQAEGCKFRSATDTEVIAHLIGQELRQQKKSNRAKKTQHATSGKYQVLISAVQAALKQLEGTYGLAVVFRDFPGVVIVARLGSPLVIGVGNDEHFVASDPGCLSAYTNRIVYLADQELAVITAKDLQVIHRDQGQIKHAVKVIDQKVAAAELGEFPHYMLKEIFEQPETIQNAMRGRLNMDDATARFGGLNLTPQQLRGIDRIILTACGTSWHAALVGEYLIEELARIPVEVEYASELRYRNPPLPDRTLMFAITQSGETADTLAALREVKRKGHSTLAICNVVGSTIAREADGGIYLHAGPEIGVASTKAFTSQCTVLTLLALYLGRMRHLNFDQGLKIIEQLQTLPEKVTKALETNNEVRKIAAKYCQAENVLYLGRKFNFPVALEGALKLKEISYIHAEGYPAAEMKHGPIALVDEKTPSVFLIPKGSVYNQVKANAEEIKARKGPIIAIVTEGDESLNDIADDIIHIPAVEDFLQPILAVIPLQLLAYHIAVMRGCDVDKPRNLAKSVTVE